MYSNSSYCNDFNYVRSNLLKGQVIEYIELNNNELPEPIYEDDPKRYWEIWKKFRGYKLYNVNNCEANIIDNNDDYESRLLSGGEKIRDGYVRLYRTIQKPSMVHGVKKELSKGPDLADKPTVPCDPVIPVGAG